MLINFALHKEKIIAKIQYANLAITTLGLQGDVLSLQKDLTCKVLSP